MNCVPLSSYLTFSSWGNVNYLTVPIQLSDQIQISWVSVQTLKEHKVKVNLPQGQGQVTHFKNLYHAECIYLLTAVNKNIDMLGRSQPLDVHVQLKMYWLYITIHGLSKIWSPRLWWDYYQTKVSQFVVWGYVVNRNLKEKKNILAQSHSQKHFNKKRTWTNLFGVRVQNSQECSVPDASKFFFISFLVRMWLSAV